MSPTPEQVEAVARVLYQACRKYITPEPPRQEWKPTADFLDMARAVLARADAAEKSLKWAEEVYALACEGRRAAEAEVARLRALVGRAMALAGPEYDHHAMSCGMNDTPALPCSCGWASILADPDGTAAAERWRAMEAALRVADSVLNTTLAYIVGEGHPATPRPDLIHAAAVLKEIRAALADARRPRRWGG